MVSERTPETSIVVPTNGGRFLGEAVASVIAQTVRDWELVIVDDGSTDGTADVVSSLCDADPRVRVVRQANSGIARARNRGLAELSSDSSYVALIDHDDLWMPNTLEILRSALSSRPSASAAHGRAIAVDESGRPVERPSVNSLPTNRRAVIDGQVRMWPVERPTEFAVLAYDDCVVGVGSALIRRSILNRVGGFDWRAEPADDYDLWVRMSRVGEIAFVNEVVLAYRQHRDNRSRGPLPPRGRGTGYVRRKIVTSRENTTEQRRVALDGFRAHERVLLEARWAGMIADWKQRRYSAGIRQAAALLSRLGAYARGCPWWWQR